MSPSRRFIPFIIFGVFGAICYLLAALANSNGADKARTCQAVATCAEAQIRFNNAVLFAVIGTTLVIVGGFVAVLIGQRQAAYAPAPGPNPQYRRG